MDLTSSLTDEELIQGFKNFDPRITKEAFYGICRDAHRILANRYGLDQKKAFGFDFYSLAHDYYIRLATEGFATLESRPQGITLFDWMLGGYRFVILDALKAYNRQYEKLAITEPDKLYNQIAAHPDDHLIEDIVANIHTAYGDPVMDEVAKRIFALGYKQKEVAAELGLTPSAVNQRYKRMMDEVVIPYVCSNYWDGLEGEFKPESAPQERIIITSKHCRIMPFDDEFEIRYQQSGSEIGTAEEPAASYNWEQRITDDDIQGLADFQVYVFSSDLAGLFATPSARQALHFGADRSKGAGRKGATYGIPTMNGGLKELKARVRNFIRYAKSHPELEFLVTEIGCEMDGYDPMDIAPLFRSARTISNISLPFSFWEEFD